MPVQQLEERVAVVTGAGRGIGRAIALGFARQGAHIAAVARTQSELESLVTDIRQFGGKALPVIADLSKPDLPSQLIPQIEQAFGTIDILVNNAGIGT